MPANNCKNIADPVKRKKCELKAKQAGGVAKNSGNTSVSSPGLGFQAMQQWKKNRPPSR